ncbi:MAG TPA: hypothetical protein VFC68_07320, partial [Treponemataceae bacterium]|nr:hypothetical protein [Treponemataceae bacterium]
YHIYMFCLKSLKKRFTILIFIVVGVFCSCSNAKESALSLKTDTLATTRAPLANMPLMGLNSNAIAACIPEAAKSQYMFFAFTDDFSISKDENASVNLCFLELEENSVLTVAFLYKNDFAKKYTLVKELQPRPVISGKINSENAAHGLSLSLAFANDVRGFLVYCDKKMKLDSARLEDTRYGWEKNGQNNWYGYSSAGGIIPSNNPLDISGNEVFDFTGCSVQNKVYKIKMQKSNIGTISNQQKCILHFGNQKITIRRAPEQQVVTLYPHTLQEKAPIVFAHENASMLTALLLIPDENYIYCEKALQNGTAEHCLDRKPVVADPGLMVYWPQDTWRYDDYEVFQWEQFPNILAFDTKDYAIQARMFKRLAFYVEKHGYVGTLWANEVLADKHGFNAHDYQAKDLALFFAQAEHEKFQLNDLELELKEILLQNGILMRDSKNIIVAGFGAIASISREIPSYLRVRLLCHELLHGIFFTDEKYRKKISQVYAQTDSKSIEFLLQYWQSNDSLGYDMSNMFLIQNEFMAYMVQQSVNAIPHYYAQNIANWRSVNKHLPELAKYIRDTHASGFVEAAENIQDYLFFNWGFAAGRVSLVSLY